MSTKRIADKVNLDNIQFERSGGRKGKGYKAVVSFAPSTKTLYFNPKMTKLLDMANWKEVLVGYDRTSRVLVLKESDTGEFGSVRVRLGKSSKKKGIQALERASNSRVISIDHLIRSLGLGTRKYYKAERDGKMIFLEALDEDE